MVRYHIHPGNGCHFIACGRYDVLAAVPCESTKAVEENQVTLVVLQLRAPALSRFNAGADCNRKTDFAELFHEWPITIGNNHTSYGLEQNSILSSDMVGEFYEDSAAAVIAFGFDAR